MLKQLQVLIALLVLLIGAGMSHAEAPALDTLRGVVTYHLIPAKVIRVNEIVREPKSGTSYIGDKSILVELDNNIDVRANWSVVELEYFKYPESRVIRYEVLGEQYEITVNYHARSVRVDGNISDYIEQ